MSHTGVDHDSVRDNVMYTELLQMMTRVEHSYISSQQSLMFLKVTFLQHSKLDIFTFIL